MTDQKHVSKLGVSHYKLGSIFYLNNLSNNILIIFCLALVLTSEQAFLLCARMHTSIEAKSSSTRYIDTAANIKEQAV